MNIVKKKLATIVKLKSYIKVKSNKTKSSKLISEVSIVSKIYSIYFYYCFLLLIIQIIILSLDLRNSLYLIICKIINVIIKYKQLIYFCEEVKLRTIKDKDSKKKYCKFLNQCSNFNIVINNTYRYTLILKRLL